MAKKAPLFLILAVFVGSACFADIVQWKVERVNDEALLADVFLGEINRDSLNWVLGLWSRRGFCTKDYPCFICDDIYHYEFFPDGKFRCWAEYDVAICIEDEHFGSKKSRTVSDVTHYGEGSYRIIDENTVELSADWGIGK